MHYSFDVIMLQEVGDHVTGDHMLRAYINSDSAVSKYMDVVYDGGFATMVRKGLCINIKHELRKLFPNAVPGREHDNKTHWRRLQHVRLTCCIEESHATAVDIFNVHIVSGRKNHTSGQNRSSTLSLKLDAVKNLFSMAGHHDIIIVAGDFSLPSTMAREVARLMGPRFIMLHGGRMDYILSSQALQPFPLRPEVGKSWGGVRHTHGAVGAFLQLHVSAAASSHIGVPPIPVNTGPSSGSVDAAIDRFMTTLPQPTGPPQALGPRGHGVSRLPCHPARPLPGMPSVEQWRQPTGPPSNHGLPSLPPRPTRPPPGVAVEPTPPRHPSQRQHKVHTQGPQGSRPVEGH